MPDAGDSTPLPALLRQSRRLIAQWAAFPPGPDAEALLRAGAALDHQILATPATDLDGLTQKLRLLVECLAEEDLTAFEIGLAQACLADAVALAGEQA